MKLYLKTKTILHTIQNGRGGYHRLPRAVKGRIGILNIKNEKFSIELEKKVYLDDGDIFEYSVTKHVYEHFVFETIFVNN